MRKILVWVCAVGMVWAQDPAKPATQEGEIAKLPGVTTRVVLAPVTVVDRDGSFVPGLTPYDFRLYDNKKLQRITEDMATHPLSVVVIVQANSEVEKILPSIQRWGCASPTAS